jgi:acetylornithine deacetylase/succinyl-diaminopimelate desuccinylase-like protein
MRITSWATVVLAFGLGAQVLPGQTFARDLLRELVEINSTSAFGSTAAAKAMAARFRSAGFPESDMVLAGPIPDKQNLVVRLHGKGAASPILLIAHLDVVDAPREGWSPGLDPFRLTERDGFFYGRGVLDMKNAVAGLVATVPFSLFLLDEAQAVGAGDGADPGVHLFFVL